LQHAVARACLRLNSYSDIEQTGIYSDEPVSSSSVSPLTDHLNPSAKTAHETTSDKHLFDEELEKLTHRFTPFIFHQPIPIALVNRLPNGLPGHTDTANPQDTAWLGVFRYPQKSIFIQLLDVTILFN
jgi:hypothetical protein